MSPSPAVHNNDTRLLCLFGFVALRSPALHVFPLALSTAFSSAPPRVCIAPMFPIVCVCPALPSFPCQVTHACVW